MDQQCLFGLGSVFPVKYMFKEGVNEKAEARKRREAGKPGRRKEKVFFLSFRLVSFSL